jgi:hypothetical protein
MNSIPAWSEGRGLVAAVAFTSALLVPGLAVADDETQYALILDDEGVVINVAVYHPVDSVGWLESMESKGANVVVIEENTVGIGSVRQPDGSFARDVPTAAPTPDPPAELPTPSDDAASWQQHGAPPEPTPEPRKPVIRDEALARHLGVAPADADGTVRPRGQVKTAVHIVDGVVVNASVYHTIDSVGWLEQVRAQGREIVIVAEGAAGIGWVVQPDGTITPPAPRPGMIWNGSEWRAPGTEDVDRATDVRGWALDRTEPIRPTLPGIDGASGDERSRHDDGWLIGRLIVPDEALTDGATASELAERSIVILESHGDDVIPLLARCDGVSTLTGCADDAVDRAVEVHAETTGAPVEKESAVWLQDAARRLVTWAQSLFGLIAAP